MAVRTYLLVSRKRWIRLIDGGGSYCSSQATRVGEQSHLLQNFAKYYAQTRVRQQSHLLKNVAKNYEQDQAFPYVGNYLIFLHGFLKTFDIVTLSPGLPLLGSWISKTWQRYFSC